MLRSRASKLIITFISVLLLLIVFDFLLYRPIKTWQLPSSSEVIAFSPNGEMVATVSGKPKTYYKTPNSSIHGASSTVELRKVSNGKIIHVLDFPAASSLAFSPDNSLIAIGGYGKVEIYRLSDGQFIRLFKTNHHPSSLTNFVAFSQDGKTLITRATGYPGQMTVWNFNDAQQRYAISYEKLDRYKCNRVSSDGKFIVINNFIQTLNLARDSYDNSGKQLKTIKGECSDIDFSSDGQILAILNGGSKGSVNIFSTQSNRLLPSISLEPFDNKELSTKIAISPDNRYVAVSFTILYSDSFFGIPPSYPLTSHGRIRIWNLENGKLVATLRGHKKGTDTVAFSPDGKLLASAGKDNTIKFWHMPPYSRVWLWLIGACGLVALVYKQRN